MTGETNLGSLLRNMKPKHVPGEYVFCTIAESDENLVETPLLVFREEEGLTVVLSRDTAESLQLKYESTWGLITLTVHSNLTAVGFLAKITQRLALAGVSVNVVSAFFHDHLLVPYSEIGR
ncbi:MAG: ACT domain-containing protein, partial [Candidatus Thorarchaeota archaeon]